MRLLDYPSLKPKGIPYSKPQLWRMEKSGAFPKRVAIGAARHGWVEDEIDAWLKAKVSERDSRTA